ncbi:MAG: DinB family protein [Gemmatimonadaceae bacterium]
MSSMYGMKQLADSIRVVRKNTIQVAEDIPEAQYGYRPAPESRSVQETLVHIAWLWGFDRYLHTEAHLDSLEGFDFGALLDQSTAEERQPRTKAEVVAKLRDEGDKFVQWIESLPDELLSEQIRLPGGRTITRFEMLMGTKEHEMQHRAQLTVLERLVGVVPHFTRNLRGN